MSELLLDGGRGTSTSRHSRPGACRRLIRHVCAVRGPPGAGVPSSKKGVTRRGARGPRPAFSKFESYQAALSSL